MPPAPIDPTLPLAHRSDTQSDSCDGFKIVLFDLDHTLFDFEASKATAFHAVLSEVGITDPAALLDVFERVERPLWRGLEQGSLTLRTLNGERFRLLCLTEEFRDVCPAPPDSEAVARNYLRWLGKSGGLLPGARELLDVLTGNCRMALVSNGYGEVQRARMSNFDLDKYFEIVVVSDEIGVAKPHPNFFQQTFLQLGNPPVNSAIMIGDSLTSDIAGAQNFDLKCCWFNPFNKPQTTEGKIDFTVTDLSEIAQIVLQS